MTVTRTHRPVWIRDLCRSCGACSRRCPVRVFPGLSRETGSLRGEVARRVDFPDDLPAVPPCRAACPLGQDVPGYLEALSRGRADRALEIILEHNPFPSSLGRLCLRACMHACVRKEFDGPVRIRALKRAAAELAAGSTGFRTEAERPGRVVVVGAGPAGLSAAAFLRRRGFEVRVIEAARRPGGLLRCVPRFDLPGHALEADIKRILSLGVEFEYGRRLRSRVEVGALLKKGAGAVILAVGAGRGSPLGVNGEDLPGCLDAVTFSWKAAGGSAERLEGPAVVAGDGTLGVAAARIAVRAGARPVRLLLRRGRARASSDPDRLRQAEEEGVEVIEETWPTAILGSDRVEAVRCARLRYGPPDAAGRRWLHEIDPRAGPELPARCFVSAAGREPDLAWLASSGPDLVGPLGTLRVDATSQMTSMPGVFAAGEAVSGGRNLVASVASGVRVAAAVERHLEGRDG